MSDTGEKEREERRSSERVAVEMWVEESRNRETYFQRCKNLSVGGLFLDRTIPHPVGTIVSLRFSLPSDDTVIETKGEIVNAPEGTGLGMGIKFLGLTTEARAKIEAFVSREFGGDRGPSGAKSP